MEKSEVEMKRKISREKYESKFIKKTLRFFPDDIEKIESEISKTNLSFNDFCIRAIMKRKIKSADEENFNRDLIFQINKIGINLNQIARAVNSKDRVAVLTELVDIEKQLKALRNGS